MLEGAVLAAENAVGVVLEGLEGSAVAGEGEGDKGNQLHGGEEGNQSAPVDPGSAAGARSGGGEALSVAAQHSGWRRGATVR